MNRKFLRYIILTACISLGFLGSSYAQVAHDMRYFMQGEGTSSQIPYGNNATAGHYVHSGDAKIYYELYGKGKPIVVLHGGIVGSALEMGQFIDSLSRNYQVIAIATRGHGKSETGSLIPSYEQKAKDVAAVIQALTTDKVMVLGFSDGAYTGYFFAKHYPEKISKLIAIGAVEWKQGFRSFDMTLERLSAMDTQFWKQQLALRPNPNTTEQWLKSVNRYYNGLTIGSPIFEKISCPVLIMAGEKDQNAPLHTVLDAYHMIPHAQLSIIPNAPHPVFIANFPAVWASMKPFMNQ
ncbi:alpha/beta fold hydrolase [Sphingobacterium sp. MYb388]|uniref:alpha/beta fold hydrolase n=1 Tax=Sphingobacterium sp. MYb388 TaxID=2745437 RepID=UPI0030AAE2CD